MRAAALGLMMWIKVHIVTATISAAAVSLRWIPAGCRQSSGGKVMSDPIRWVAAAAALTSDVGDNRGR